MSNDADNHAEEKDEDTDEGEEYRAFVFLNWCFHVGAGRNEKKELYGIDLTLVYLQRSDYTQTSSGAHISMRNVDVYFLRF